MIEPLMMVFLAGMVLVFLLALYLPLFQLGEWIWIEFQDALRLTLKNKRIRQGSYIKPLGLTKCISKLSVESASIVNEVNPRSNNLNNQHPTILSFQKKWAKKSS